MSHDDLELGQTDACVSAQLPECVPKGVRRTATVRDACKFGHPSHHPAAGKARKGVLQEIIIAPAKSGFVRNSFDCVAPRAVSIRPLGQGIVAMLEVLTAFFGVMSAGIFIAHACDGYLSRP